MMMMMKESVAVMALFMTMASCVPIFHPHNDTSHHNNSIAGLEAINVTKLQQMMHTATEMTHTSNAGVCNDTMADQWMECGPCVLDPCVMVLTHNCTYGSQGEDVHHNMDTHFPFHHWFQFFQHLGHYHTESEMEDPSEEDPTYPMVSETCKKVQHNTSACFEVQEQCHRCKGIKLDTCLPESHEHYSTLEYLSSELQQET